MTCNDCIHRSVCYRADSVQSDHARKCGDFESVCKTLEQEPCEDVTTFKEHVLDAISRIGLHKSDTKEVQAVAECLRVVEALPPVNPQEPCEDAVSRQAVFDLCGTNRYDLPYNTGDRRGYDEGRIINMTKLKLLPSATTIPSVTPQEPKIVHCKDCKYFNMKGANKNE